jgi:hypothetical protein
MRASSARVPMKFAGPRYQRYSSFEYLLHTMQSSRSQRNRVSA